MRKTILAALLVFTAASAMAAEGWKGAGWYQMLNTIAGDAIYDGPFGDESDCKMTLPTDKDDEHEYSCEDLREEPW